ncbi:MAG TPA: type II toxin-antitoxin system HicB family antitoxin [Thermoanaerobaculales bacterium]|mgnify:FL=1|nr:type II toxin-antitoxin system HicB family antitoxin [Thermoanaerobaculales bacterium]HQN95952.1 type II toxin-antitoxin system HicB family antitoxin [Thermoanaerobaculales bacterium]
MTHEFAYPVVLATDASGGYVVSCPDLPELLTQGEDRADAVASAIDALEEAIAGRVRRGDDIPDPSEPPEDLDVELIRLPPIMAAKAALAIALRESGLSQSAFARETGVDEKEVRRLLDPRHPSKLPRLQKALLSVGREVEIRVVPVARPSSPREFDQVPSQPCRVREAKQPGYSTMARSTDRRADEKLRFAKVHLRELIDHAQVGGHDKWETAHQESCFYHLAGAVEAVLHEINAGYGLNLGLKDIDWNTVRAKLTTSNQSSPAFDLLLATKTDKSSWLWQLFEWRNHGAHRGRVGEMIHLSTSRVVDNEFKDPRTGEVQSVYPELGCLDVLRRLTVDVEHLIDRCRIIDPSL